MARAWASTRGRGTTRTRRPRKAIEVGGGSSESLLVVDSDSAREVENPHEGRPKRWRASGKRVEDLGVSVNGICMG